MKGFDLDEALEKAVEEVNKMPGKEPLLVLPPREGKENKFEPAEEEFLSGSQLEGRGTYTNPPPYNKGS